MREYCSTDLEAVAAGAEFCVLATPVGVMGELLRKLLPFLAPRAVVTDVGSVKGLLVPELEGICRESGATARFVGSHPMAGSEQTGFKAARADLFNGATCFVTPTETTDVEAQALTEDFWRQLGGRVAHARPEDHDPIVARISHVPHLLASILVNLVAEGEMDLCGGGFRDTTRIASGSPPMWTEILLENGAAVEKTLADLEKAVAAAREVIASGQEAALFDLLERAKVARDRLAAKS
jgi:prephenate dehydrogenase